MRASTRAIVLAVTALAYTAFLLALSSAPFTDAPNHLARAAIMKSLWFDAHSPYRGMFAVSHSFMPYMLPDIGLVFVIRIFGFDLACPLWSTLTMLALVFAVRFYTRRILTTPWAIAAAVLCSWYIATNYLFILGFFSFQWGVAASFIALGALEAWRATNALRWILLYAGACFVTYGAHPACFAMLAAIVATIAILRVLRKEQTWPRAITELLPFAVLIAYHLLFVPAHPEALGGKLTHNTIGDKFGHFLEALFVRENYVLERSVLILFWGILIAAIWSGRRTRLATHWQLATICALAALIYFILPFGLGGVSYVDERALPFFFIPGLILALRIFEDSAPTPTRISQLLLACFILSTANLAALAWFLPRQNREVAEYRSALQKIPPHKTVLTIHTRHRDGNTYPLRHAGSFYAVDRESYIPYLFSQENASGPAGYFSDFSPLYRPPQSWYMGKSEPDWEKVRRSYDYVVITKPWKPARIDLSDLELYYDNQVATVFRVKPRRREP